MTGLLGCAKLISVAELAERLGLVVHGSGEASVTHAAGLAEAGEGALSFLGASGKRRDLAATRATVVIVPEDALEHCPVTALVSTQPHASFARALGILAPRPRPPAGVHPTAVIGDRVRLGRNVSIGAHAVIGDDCCLGDEVEIGPGCVLLDGVQLARGVRLVARVTLGERTCIGADGLVHPGAVIGSDGFGYTRQDSEWLKVPQIGRVVIGERVEIGANAAIDRGALGDTTIGNGVKIDNLVHIAHNCRIGDDVAIAAGCGIAGSARIGDHCAFGGLSGVAGHVQIVDGAQFTGMSQVTGNVNEPGLYSSGTGLQKNPVWRRTVARLHRIDTMARSIRSLQNSLFSLSGRKPTATPGDGHNE